jgi:hypothetical protein
MYGTVNYVVKTASSTSELVFKVLQTLQVQLDKEIASNLYSGLTVATNNFTSYSVNADTFEAASTLLKSGAMKRPPMRQVSSMSGTQMSGMQMPRPMQGANSQRRMPMPMPMDDIDDLDDEAPYMPPVQSPQPRRMNPAPQQQQMRPQPPQHPHQPPQPRSMHQQQRPQPRPQQQPAPMQQRPPQQATQPQQMRQDQPVPFEETMKTMDEVELQPGTPEAPAQTPQDWLKPKIFKGGGGLV